jgi:hypothetical protein
MTKKYTKGEDAKDYLEKHLGITDYICLAATPDEGSGGFSLIVGEPDMVVSILVMAFKQNPELLIQSFITIAKIFAEVTPEQMAQNAQAMVDECDCDGCQKRKARAAEGKADGGKTYH